MESQSLLKQQTIMIAVSVFLRSHCSEATVSISPSGIAPVCNGNHQLELMCNTTGRLLDWSFFMIDNETGAARKFAMRGISADGPREAQTSTQSRFNSTVITFSRNSAQNSPVLTSRVLISGVSDHFNGTMVTCMDVASETMESTTIITQFNSLSQDHPEVNVSKQFESHIVTVTLEWTQESPFFTFYIDVIPQIPVLSKGSTSAMLSMSYNIPYNVSVLGAHFCGERVTIFTHPFYFINCGNPIADTSDKNNTTVLGSISPTVNTGSTVDTIICTPGIYSEDNNVNMRLNIILGSSFGVIACLVIITAVILTLAYLIKKKIKGSNEANTKENLYECYSTNGDKEVCTSSGDQNNSKIATDGIVYADIGPSSFIHQSHRQPTIDDGATEYAQIKHNPKHTEQSSVSWKTQPIVKESLAESESRIGKLTVNLDNLLIQLRPQLAPKWYQFGEAAGIDTEILDRFINQCSPEDCIMEMLDCWLRKCVKQPTWIDVAKILNMIELPQLAMEIENIHVTGKFPVEADMDWIPQSQVFDSFISESAAADSPPPPIPPKMLESKEPLNQLDHDSTPALPPKPMNMCGIVTGVPLRPPK